MGFPNRFSESGCFASILQGLGLQPAKWVFMDIACRKLLPLWNFLLSQELHKSPFCAQLGSQSAVNANGDKSKRKILMRKILSVTLLALVAMASAADAKSGVKIGMLSCGVEGGVGFIIGSSKAVDCVYQPASGGEPEHYSGSIGKLGLDIGVTTQTVLAWAVFAPGKTNKGALNGSYTGASAEATVVVGLGANVLVGGFNNGINLQPVSVQAQSGLNIAAGVSSLKLSDAGN